jgi:hypothetical protein
MSRSGSACCVSRRDREVPKRRWGKDGSRSGRFGSARFRYQEDWAGRKGKHDKLGVRLTRWEDLVLRLFLDDEPFKLNHHHVLDRGPRDREELKASKEKKKHNQLPILP